ncbi:helix-turn-helix domain-containing protein [Haladaptatus halobius]|uniref:helix-turn-helix domain-containing protein n=1 Tax=Haladaptatus halobius TaxID=2884875 RepID=UPI001D0AC23F
MCFEAVGGAEQLSEFYSRLQSELQVEIESVQEYQRQISPTTLTRRQQTALEVAVTVGYYQIPRTGTIEDIAIELGCAHSTAGELIRKAESKVIMTFVE